MIHYGESFTACGKFNSADDDVSLRPTEVDCEDCLIIISFCNCDACV